MSISAEHAPLAARCDARLNLPDRRFVVLSENFRFRLHCLGNLGVNSGECTRPECRRWRLAITDFGKIVLAGRQNQHARRVRYLDNDFVATTRHPTKSAQVCVEEMQRAALIRLKSTSVNGN